MCDVPRVIFLCSWFALLIIIVNWRERTNAQHDHAFGTAQSDIISAGEKSGRGERRVHRAQHRQNKLRFSGVGWSAIHMRDFVEVLPFFTKLRSLNLASNNLRDDGAKILSSSLKATVSGTVGPWFMSTTDGVDTQTQCCERGFAIDQTRTKKVISLNIVAR